MRTASLSFLFFLMLSAASAQNCNVSTTVSLGKSQYTASTSSNCSYDSGPFAFSIRNPLSRQFAYFASQGFQCYSYYRSTFSYSLPYSNPNGTNASSTSFSGAPCVLYPCCVILQCQSSLGCPNLTLNTVWTPSRPRTSSSSFYYYVGGGSGGAVFLLVIAGLVRCFCQPDCTNKEPAKEEKVAPNPMLSSSATEETPLKIPKEAGARASTGLAVPV
jgi:hypothetical protein